jgi:formylglycine-generating enzyme required for sulfatase activity
MIKTRKNPSAAARLLILALNLGLLLMVCSCGTEPPAKFKNSLGMEFVLIPAGNFLMGSSREDLKQMMADFKKATGREYRRKWVMHVRDEMPRHQVEITKPFYMQTHEVSNDQFAAFIKATGYRTTAEERGGGWSYAPSGWHPLPGADWRHPLGPASSIQGKGDHPVVQVSWLDAMAFCRWLSQKESKPYSIPSEAQWEYACRGGLNKTLYSWGAEMPPQRLVANMPDLAYARRVGKERHHVQGYDDGHADTAPVGAYEANGFGLYDMIGNVWEWCLDWYEAKYYAVSPDKDPAGPPKGTHRVLRGGSFCYLPSNLRCADRFRNLPRFRCHFAGFRLAMAAPAS